MISRPSSSFVDQQLKEIRSGHYQSPEIAQLTGKTFRLKQLQNLYTNLFDDSNDYPQKNYFLAQIHNLLSHPIDPKKKHLDAEEELLTWLYEDKTFIPLNPKKTSEFEIFNKYVSFQRRLIQLDRMQSGTDDEDADPRALLKKLLNLLKSSLRVPGVVAAYVKGNQGLYYYGKIYSRVLSPLLEGFDGLWSFRKLHRLFLDPHQGQFKTKLVSQMIKLTQLALSIAVMAGALAAATLNIVAAIASVYALYKSYYILRQTQTNIQETEALIKDLKTQTLADPKNDDLSKQLECQEARLKDLRIKEYFQKRTVYRALAFLVASSLVIASAAFPPLALISFVIVVAGTINALKDQIDREKINQASLSHEESGDKKQKNASSIKAKSQFSFFSCANSKKDKPSILPSASFSVTR